MVTSRVAQYRVYRLLFLLPLTVLVGTWNVFGTPFFWSDIICLLLIAVILVGFRPSWKELVPSNQALKLAVPLILLGLMTGILQSDSFAGALNAAKSWVILPGTVAFLVAATMRSKEEVQGVRASLLNGMVLLGLVEAVAGLVRWQQHLYIEDRLAGYYNSPNAYAAGAVFALVAAAWLAWEAKGSWRWWYGGSALLILVTILLSRSLGGVASLIGVLVLLALRSPQPNIRKITTALVVVLALVGGLVAADRYKSFNGSSLQSRLQIWHVTGTLIHDDPLIGIGLRDFQSRYVVRVHELYPLATDIVEKEVPEPHSLYLALIVYNGVVGAIGFFMLFWLLAVKNIKHSFGPETWAGALLLAILIHGLVDTPFYRLDLSILVWLAVLLTLRPFYARS